MTISSTTYHVTNMRPVKPKGKAADRNPDRVLTVFGEFRHVDENGEPKGDPLTITQKVIDRETALSPVFDIDVEAGLLTLPSGERGRKASVGMSADAVADLLAGLREDADSEEEEDAEADIEVTEATK